MGLDKYRRMRKFDRTPEPAGAEAAGRGALRFVVQKHQASHLHYDFRLEMEGVLKSWAVPKGPSLDPSVKRLAMMVEDHPYDYRTFEGIIPEGNYGAGTVMVWDEGGYRAAGTEGRAESERRLLAGLHKGHISFFLEGKKLRGGFDLIKIRDRDSSGRGNSWLLVKQDDDFAETGDVRERGRSAATGLSLEEIAAGRPRIWRSHRKAAHPRPAAHLRRAVRSSIDLVGVPKGPFPRAVKPMLATLVKRAPDRPGWFYELKWDGFRAVAEVEKGRVRLYSRTEQPFNERFAPVAEALENLRRDAVLDGEVVVMDGRGKSSFQLLQSYQRTGQGDLAYVVFDILYLDGHDLRGLPLRRRKEILAEVLPKHDPRLRIGEHIEGEGAALLEALKGQGVEGMIAKDAQSPYREGARGGEWLKVKIDRRQEAVIGGFTEPRGGRKAMGALVLGVYAGKELVYIGHTGGGFDEKNLAAVHAKLLSLVQNECPFKAPPKTNAPAHWVKPELVCEVAFKEWTGDGHMRQPTFVGLREDKPPRDVHRETPQDPPSPPGETTGYFGSEPPRSRDEPENRNGSKSSAARKSRPRKEDKIRPYFGPGPQRKKPDEIEINAGGITVALGHPDKVFWPKEKYAKRDLAEHYRWAAPYILPYLKDRPESLHRYPDGIDGESFYQKNHDAELPGWIETVTVHSENEERAIRYLMCQNEATLLYMVNMGCVEMNPWSSRVQALDKPDYFVVDLDPEDIPFEKVIETALMVRKVLKRAGAPSYCKTSGSRGLHIFVPLGARYTYDQARQFSELIVHMVHRMLPETTSLERSPLKRQQRVYLDFLQNRRGQTLAAPYSVRPRPGATVSTPLKWEEVKPGLDPKKFTIRTIRKRVKELGDLWKPVLGPGIDLAKCLDRLEKEAD